MKRTIPSALLFVCGCAFERPPAIVERTTIEGRLDGLWSGATVVLSLDGGVEETLDADGPFELVADLAPGATYEVLIAEQPEMHACVVTRGVGTAGDDDPANVSVICQGPPVAITFSAARDWEFDAISSEQTVETSLLQQETTITVTAPDATDIRTNDLVLDSGASSLPLALALGSNEFETVVRVDNLSRRFVTYIERGALELEQAAYVKASNTGPGDMLGYSVALSGDTLAIGAREEDSGGVGINGDQGDASFGAQSGAVYVFRRDATGAWAQEAYIKASNRQVEDRFGHAVALSGDTLVVGAIGEDSLATGVNGNQSNDPTALTDSGAAYVFVRNGSAWQQQAYLKASNTEASDTFGYAVSISGNLIVVGAYDEDGAATGVDGNQASNAASGAGAAYVFRRSGDVWTPDAYLKASNTEAGDAFGISVAIAGDLLAVGAMAEDSNATGVDGDQSSNAAGGAGAVYLFRRSGGTWSQEAYLKASNAAPSQLFGRSVSVSGATVAVGAPSESGGTNNSGAVYVFRKSSSAWTQDQYLKASNQGSADGFGEAVSLSGDVLAVGAPFEDGGASGIDGAADDSSPNAGATYLFVRGDGGWIEEAYVKASNPDGADQAGAAVACAASGCVMTAVAEDGPGVGIDDDEQASNTSADSGAAYLIR